MFRIEPLMPAAAYRTYQVASPRATHRRPASCAEAECAMHQRGWRSTVDERTDFGQAQARYVRLDSGRRYSEYRDEAGMTVFEFTAGQRCFGQHTVPLDRPPLFVVRDGDWRGNPLGTPPRQHTRAEHWVEDFAEHQDQLKTAIERG